MQCLSRIGMILLVLFLAASASPAENSSLPLVMANDNRTPAGELKNGVLNLRLELRPGRWYPEDGNGGYRDVYAFAEEDHAPQSSGPLIRVPQGTQIHATIHNTLPLPAKIYGLHRHPGDSKRALRLGPGETRDLQFLAGEPGTYLYWATTSDKTLVELREDGETMLSGAFVVDAPGTKPDDRIFVLGIWVKDLAHPFRGNLVDQREELAVHRASNLQTWRDHPLACDQSDAIRPCDAPAWVLFHGGWGG